MDFVMSFINPKQSIGTQWPLTLHLRQADRLLQLVIYKAALFDASLRWHSLVFILRIAATQVYS